jgi:hypothetical protein
MVAERRITIVRSHCRYAEQMEVLLEGIYGYEASNENQIFTAEQFCHHMTIFPAGQFVALDRQRVVGLTVSMRIDFDPEHSFIEPWWTTVNNGWLNHKPALKPRGGSTCVAWSLAAP